MLVLIVKLLSLWIFDMKSPTFLKTAVPVLILLLGLTGCATTPEPVEEDTEAFASKVISEKVGVAATAQRDYVALVNDDQEVKLKKQAAMASDLVNIDYIGKPQELLQTIAVRYGYRYIESGKWADLRTINIRVQKTSPIEVLRNIGYQIDAYADVVLEKNTKIIRLTYKPLPPRG